MAASAWETEFLQEGTHGTTGRKRCWVTRALCCAQQSVWHAEIAVLKFLLRITETCCRFHERFTLAACFNDISLGCCPAQAST